MIRQLSVRELCFRGYLSVGGIWMSRKVLVVDDSAVMRKIIIHALGAVLDCSDEVVEAADGNEALRQFVLNQFELVLTNWYMPGRSGLNIIKCIRELDKDVRIIMITTEAERRRVLQAISAGVSDY